MSVTTVAGAAPLRCPTSVDPLARGAQPCGRRDESDRRRDLGAGAASLRDEIGDARLCSTEGNEVGALGGGLGGGRRRAQRDAKRRRQQRGRRAVELGEGGSELGLRSSGPEQRPGHERHGRSRDHVHQPDLSRAPPVRLDHVDRQDHEGRERRLPDGERQGSACVGGDEDQKREDDPRDGTRGADDPEDRDRGQEPSRRSPDCCDRRSFAGDHTRAQHGERAERDPEPVPEVADARHEHREADGATGPQRVAEAHRADRHVTSDRLPCTPSGGRPARRRAHGRQVSPVSRRLRSANRGRRGSDAERHVRQQSQVSFSIHAVEDPVCGLAPQERVVSPPLEVETMLCPRSIKPLDVGQSVATKRPSTSAEDRLHAHTQRHVRGRVCPAGV